MLQTRESLSVKQGVCVQLAETLGVLSASLAGDEIEGVEMALREEARDSIESTWGRTV